MGTSNRTHLRPLHRAVVSARGREQWSAASPLNPPHLPPPFGICALGRPRHASLERQQGSQRAHGIERRYGCANASPWRRWSPPQSPSSPRRVLRLRRTTEAYAPAHRPRHSSNSEALLSVSAPRRLHTAATERRLLESCVWARASEWSDPAGRRLLRAMPLPGTSYGNRGMTLSHGYLQQRPCRNWNVTARHG